MRIAGRRLPEPDWPDALGVLRALHLFLQEATRSAHTGNFKKSFECQSKCFNLEIRFQPGRAPPEASCERAASRPCQGH